MDKTPLNSLPRRRRYPGPKPFSVDDESLFFGREDEKDTLISIIKTNKVTVLFGRSGFGKSSLIEAGVIPFFEKEFKYKTVKIRFESNLNNKADEKSLQKQVIKNFKKDELKGDLFLRELALQEEDISLWQVFKTLQWDLRKDFDGILFVLDQFEEIFNFPESDYKKLASELSEVIYNRMPQQFQNKFLDRIKNDSHFLEEFKDRIDFIKQDIPITFLIGIRSDRLYLLDEIGDDLPLIFDNRLRLRRLNICKLTEVISKPASLTGSDFESQPFKYTDEAIQEITDYLSYNKVNPLDPKIETFQLQIICEHIEEDLVIKEKKTVIDRNDLSNLAIVTQKYYKNIFETTDNETREKVFGDADQLFIRFLVERKLIDSKTNNRICLDKIFVTAIGFDDVLLDKLIETKIVRRELNTVSGQSIELSHDTLIDPILKAAQSELGNLDEKLIDYYNKIIAGFPKKYESQFQNLEKKFVTQQEGNLSPLREEELSGGEQKILQNLIENRIVLKYDGNGRKNFYILNEAFQDCIIKKNKTGDVHLIRKNYISIIVSALFIIGILCWFSYKALHLYYKENAYNVATQLPIDGTDNKDSVKQKLVVLRAVYKELENDSSRNRVASSKLVSIINDNSFFGKEIKIGKSPVSFKVNNNNDQILVLLAQKSQLDNSPMYSNTLSYNDIMRETAILYSRDGKKIDTFENVYDASFIEDSSFITILRKTSKADIIEIWKIADQKKILKKRLELIWDPGISIDSAFFVAVNVISYPDLSADVIIGGKTKYGYSRQPFRVTITEKENRGYVTNPSQQGDIDLTRTIVSDTLYMKDKMKILWYRNDSLALKMETIKGHLLSDNIFYIKNIPEINEGGIANAYFSKTGDTIFVSANANMGNILLFTNTMQLLSKFNIGQNSSLNKINNLIVSIKNDALIVTNLRDSATQQVNTANSGEIIKWIDGHNWKPSKEDSNFGLVEKDWIKNLKNILFNAR
ncbi:MAG: hypothetical protein ABI325_10930 [Ginsengibacter sp.]